MCGVERDVDGGHDVGAVDEDLLIAVVYQCDEPFLGEEVEHFAGIGEANGVAGCHERVVEPGLRIVGLDGGLAEGGAESCDDGAVGVVAAGGVERGREEMALCDLGSVGEILLVDDAEAASGDGVQRAVDVEASLQLHVGLITGEVAGVEHVELEGLTSEFVVEHVIGVLDGAV